MKRNALTVIISILLVLVCIAANGSGAWGGLECYMLKKLQTELPAADKIEDVEKAIKLIKENEETYLEGVDAIYQGDEKLLQGSAVIASGRSKLKEGSEELAVAQAQYDEAAAQLAEGKSQLAEAQARMEEARPQYEEGKEQLQKLERVQPLLERYVEFKNGTLENYDGFNSLNAWYIATVIPYLASQGLELPSDMDAFTESMGQQIEEGEAMLAEYEAAEAQLKDAEAQINAAEAQLNEAKQVLDSGYKTIDDGYAQLDNAQSQLSYAASQLEEGKATLEQFEDAIGQLENGISELMKVQPICDRLGNVAVEGISGRLGDDFDIYKYNEDGEILSMLNGEPQLDMDKCLEVCTAYREYVADYEKDLGREFWLRAPLDGLIIAVSVFGIIAAIKALRGKKNALKHGIILTGLAAAVNIYGIVVGYASFAHPDGQTEYTGLLPFLGIVLLAVMALVFTLVCIKPTKKFAAENEIPAAEAIEEDPVAAAEREMLEAKRIAEAKKARIAEIVAEVREKKAAEAKAREEAEKNAAEREKMLDEKKAHIEAVTAEVIKNAAEPADASDAAGMTEQELAEYEKSKSEYEEALKKYLELRNKYRK